MDMHGSTDTNSSQEITAYDHGMLASVDGRPRSENPFQPRTAAPLPPYVAGFWEQWDKGWTDCTAALVHSALERFSP
jgi:hypothetical protein